MPTRGTSRRPGADGRLERVEPGGLIGRAGWGSAVEGHRSQRSAREGRVGRARLAEARAQRRTREDVRGRCFACPTRVSTPGCRSRLAGPVPLGVAVKPPETGQGSARSDRAGPVILDAISVSPGLRWPLRARPTVGAPAGQVNALIHQVRPARPIPVHEFRRRVDNAWTTRSQKASGRRPTRV